MVAFATTKGKENRPLKVQCVYPFYREGGINLFGDHRGSILSNRAEISQEG